LLLRFRKIISNNIFDKDMCASCHCLLFIFDQLKLSVRNLFMLIEQANEMLIAGDKLTLSHYKPKELGALSSQCVIQIGSL